MAYSTKHYNINFDKWLFHQIPFKINCDCQMNRYKDANLLGLSKKNYNGISI